MFLARRSTIRCLPFTRGVSGPNTPLELDPSMQQLLRDTDLSLLRSRKHKPRVIHELESTPVPAEDQVDQTDQALEESEDEAFERCTERRSAAALYGSKRVGAVMLPFELERSVMSLIGDSDKHQLRSDAKRLFQSSTSSWAPTPSSSTKTRTDHHIRDALAYVAVGLPAQYAAIENVMREVRDRLGPHNHLGLSGWVPEAMVDFSKGTAAPLWAALKIFRGTDAPDDEASLPHSTVKKYIGITPHSTMATLSRRLFDNVDIGGCDMSFMTDFKPQHQSDSPLSPELHPNSMAICAFTLSALPTDAARRRLARNLWNSGAEVMVVIDRGTQAGFGMVADARRRLLRYGRQEALRGQSDFDEDQADVDADLEEIDVGGQTFVEQRPKPSISIEEIEGLSHVVAPCPHDGSCPLYAAMTRGGPGKDFCHFSQRLQRPSFVRLTKHEGQGEEDTAYSYVVIRRGPRPRLHVGSERRGTGRIGAVGKEEAEKEMAKSAGDRRSVFEPHEEIVLGLNQDAGEDAAEDPAVDGEALRLEAYEWPRIVYPPLKRSGHIIMDVCTRDAEIARHTITKSQGKQAYYDARKSAWGDSFPHPPKGKPIIRTRGVKRLSKMPIDKDDDAPTMEELLRGIV